ncbi:MAG: 2-oxoglutarate dehydrogenase complex dihydrolipoyllysine-residue succinyltransferase [Acidobacteriota bacterium]|jgi:2-oxoglutarate dehydrogenase E2 component (dihydrolipoamide succinyltransferase)
MPANIVVPEMGESIVDARVARWLKNEGDAVTIGEPLVELETDKVDIEVSATQNGVLEKILQPAGADVKIGEVLGVIAEGEGRSAPPAAVPEAAAAAAPAAAPSAPTTPVAATPSARRAAREQNIDLAAVRPDGPRITKADVDKTRAAAPAPAPAAAAPSAPAAPAARPAVAPAPPRRPAGERTETRERMSKRRATIARRLVEAQQTAAMLTTFNEVDMSQVMQLRARQKDAFRNAYGISLGIASFFVRAAVVALREFPRLNAEIQDDVMVLKHYYDIGIAVGAPEGLVVPVLRDVDRMTFAEIEAGIRDFAQRAHDGTLTLEDLRGGTFSITNGGVYGSLNSTPILNPPQVGILGLHAIKDRPVAVDGQVVVRPMMNIALTYDHRIVDGSEAVRFLVRIKELVEDPGALLIGS